MYNSEDIELVKRQLIEIVTEFLDVFNKIYVFPQNNEVGVSMFVNPNQETVSKLTDYGFMEPTEYSQKLFDRMSELDLNKIEKNTVSLPYDKTELYKIVQTKGEIAPFCPISIRANKDRFEININPSYNPQRNSISREEINEITDNIKSQNIVLQKHSIDIFLKRKHEVVETVLDDLPFNYPMTLTFISKNTEADLPLFQKLKHIENERDDFNFELIGTKNTINGELRKMFPNIIYTHHTDISGILRTIDRRNPIPIA